MKIKTVTLALAFLFASNLFSQSGALDFQISNLTGYDLHYIQLSPSNSNNWGEDIIPTDIFGNGSTYNVFVPTENASTCQYDILVTDMNGDGVEFSAINLCNCYEIT